MPVKSTYQWETGVGVATCGVPAPSHNLSTPSSRMSWSQSPTTDPGSSSHLLPPASCHFLGSSNRGEAGLREVESAGTVLSTEALGDAEGRQREERRNPAAARLRGWHQKMRCKQQFWAEGLVSPQKAAFGASNPLPQL